LSKLDKTLESHDFHIELVYKIIISPISIVTIRTNQGTNPFFPPNQCKARSKSNF